MTTGNKKSYGYTVLLVCILFLSVLIPVLGAVGDASIIRYDDKRSGNSQLVSNIVEPEARWMYDSTASYVGSPIAGDINNDGKIEIVFGTNEGNISALDENGNEIWTTQVLGAVYAPPAMGDIDGDGIMEIVVGGYYLKKGDPNLYALNGEDGSFLWTFSTMDKGAPFEKGFESAPTIKDINNDGIQDVLIGSKNYYFYALNGPDASIIWESKFEHFIRSTSPLGDIDQDGKDEILVVDNHALARLFEMDGSLDWERYLLGYGSAPTPMFADVDGDGYDEIIFFSIGYPGSPSIYNHDGTLLWTNEEYTFFYSSPTLYDVDGDGLLDIINVDSNDQFLIAYKGTDGSILYATEPFEKNFMGPGLITADIDGDGGIEVLVTANPNLFSINADNGSVEWIYDSDGQRVSGPLVVDLDEDGLAEILISINGKMICLQNRMGPMDLLDKIIEYILGLDDDCFKNNADNRKNSLVNKLEEIRKMIMAEDYDAAISKLTNDIRPKMDGEGKNDWITCESAQDDLKGMIDELIEMLENL
jgi:outer membrane protein assembly factor BamB